MKYQLHPGRHLLTASGLVLRGPAAERAFDRMLTARDELAAECERRAERGMEFVPTEVETLWRETYRRHGVAHLLRPPGQQPQYDLEARMRRTHEFEYRVLGPRADSGRALWRHYHPKGHTVHRGLAAYTGRNFTPHGQTRDDLISARLAGLLKAHRTFDPDRGDSFDKWAAKLMKQAQVEYIRAWTRERQAPLSLDFPLGEEGTTTVHEFATLTKRDRHDTNPADIQPTFEMVVGFERFRELLGELSDLERSCLEAHVCGHSTAEIAAKLGTDRRAVQNALDRVQRKATA